MIVKYLINSANFPKNRQSFQNYVIIIIANIITEVHYIMAFSILSKRMLENDDIKKILNQINDYNSIFDLNQTIALGIDLDNCTRITLK